MTKLRLDQLPPAARARVEAQLGKGSGATSGRRKKAVPTGQVDVRCVACGEPCTSEPAMKRHRDATGHGHFRIPLD